MNRAEVTNLESEYIVIVLEGSPSRNSSFIMLQANTTARGMWSQLTHMAEINSDALTSFYRQDLSSDLLFLGSCSFRKLAWNSSGTTFIHIKNSIWRKFQFLVQLCQIFKDSVESVLVSADIYITVSADVYPIVCSDTKVAGAFECKLEHRN